MIEGIPNNCAAMDELSKDGKDAEEIATAVFKCPTPKDAETALYNMGFDSLDAVETSMAVETCDHCAKDGTGCRIGSLIVEIVEAG